MFRLLQIRNNIDSLIAAMAGFFIIFLFTRHGGIGLCPDGVVYTTTAQNLCVNGTLTDFTHRAMINFPAFYPLFLAGIIFLTGLKPLIFGPFLNSFLFAVVIYTSGYIMQNFTYRSKWYKCAVLSCIVLSPGLLEVYSMMWSETVFIFLLLAFVISMHKYLQTHARSSLVTAAIIASVASVTRYAGITIIGAGIIFILLDMKSSLRQRLKDLLLYGLISPVLLIINLIRNYFVSGTETGMREKSLVGLSRNIHDAGSVFNDWVPFLHEHNSFAGLTTLILIFLLIIVSVRHFIDNRRFASYESMAAVFSLLYISFMIVMASISRFETLDSRFFSPAFIFLVWSCSSWIISLPKKINSSTKKWMTILGSVIFLSFQYGQLDADYETWDGVKDAGIPGYTEDQWRYSQTVKFIEKNRFLFRKGYTVYSNAYDAVYFFTGEPGKFLPNKEFDYGVKSFMDDPHCYAVWFTDGEDFDQVDMNFITHVKKMKLVQRFDDGSIYEYDK